MKVKPQMIGIERTLTHDMPDRQHEVRINYGGLPRAITSYVIPGMMRAFLFQVRVNTRLENMWQSACCTYFFLLNAFTELFIYIRILDLWGTGFGYVWVYEIPIKCNHFDIMSK